ncbi:MAG: 16S rRNA (cytosine(1402)-N(4))-methyltransferase RsmH [Chloroflexi bacterium]|nr:16S rRNA (cytosine(1402)-N(4))-methyltransferase RsmH [Chloroflexota bacterium]
MLQHIPVLLSAVIEALQPADPTVARLIDGTVGGGGHSLAMLEAGIDEILALDRDELAIAQARQTLATFAGAVSFHHGSTIEMRAAATALGWEAVDAILLDLGLSSLQLDDPGRGFSFRHDAPLDMRFDASADIKTAEVLVNELDAGELADLLFRYGEERHARRIARAIVTGRPVSSTRELAELVSGAIPAPARRQAKKHPATKTFQALRIAVNQELEALEQVIPIAVDLLRPGGRLAVISFHSLEDRIVKRAFKQLSTPIVSPPGMASIQAKRARVKLITRKAIAPDDAELSVNPRSRSAKLRVVEKL